METGPQNSDPIPQIIQVTPPPDAADNPAIPAGDDSRPSTADPMPATTPTEPEVVTDATITPPAKASKATGPKYFKDITAQNALRLGLTADKFMVLKHQDPAIYERFHDRNWAALDPQDPIEENLAERYIQKSWLAQRAIMMESIFPSYLLEQNPAKYDMPAGISEEDPENDENLRIFKLIANESYDMADGDLGGKFRHRAKQLIAEADKALEMFYKCREMRKKAQKDVKGD
jgi:hypothetical protein